VRLHAYTEKLTQDWIATNFSEFIGKDEWPPHSRDVNPLELSCLGNYAWTISFQLPKPKNIFLFSSYEPTRDTRTEKQTDRRTARRVMRGLIRWTRNKTETLLMLRLFLFIIGDPISDVTMWKLILANKSRALGWIWMTLGSWDWGLKR